MIDAITPDSFKGLCQKWATVIKHKENLIEICPPVSGPFMRVRQLLADKNIQKEIFGDILPALFLIDNIESDRKNLKTIDDFAAYYLAYKPAGSFASYLNTLKKPVGLFLFGFDTLLQKDPEDLLQSIKQLLNKTQNLSIILLTELNIEDSSLYDMFLRKTQLLQSISYQPLYSSADSLQFLKHLEEKWSFTYPEGMKEQLVEKIGGHFLLLKETARIVQQDKNKSVEDILLTPILERKGVSIFEGLNAQDRETIVSILRGNEPKHISEYLLQTGLVTKEKKIGLPYFQIIKEKLIEKVPLKKLTKEDSLELALTESERLIFERLKKIGALVSREEVAEVLWGEKWDERYSDWAIDQVIHRIRVKIDKSKLPYILLTKKGKGFILLVRIVSG